MVIVCLENIIKIFGRNLNMKLFGIEIKMVKSVMKSPDYPSWETPLTEEEKLLIRLERLEKLVDCLCVIETGWVGERKKELKDYAVNQVLERGSQAYYMLEADRRKEEKIKEYEMMANKLQIMNEDMGDKIPDYMRMKRGQR